MCALLYLVILSRFCLMPPHLLLKYTHQNRKKKISYADEEWLDQEGNFMEEDTVVHTLENASDYEHGFKRLTTKVLRNSCDSERFKDPRTNLFSPLERHPARKRTVQPKFTHAKNATLEQRIKILDWHHSNGVNQSKTTRQFAAKYPNLRLKQPGLGEARGPAPLTIHRE
ncbi:hypothetical protein B0H16DRAFT_1455047 [Mycena metata]|uniref:Uncharacterized protein n=1 Tax=Mycena metata TaxID=1033252 RepID=A0AAD7JG91_9AGAR|nr:hypothetical protein B0H16DRAFT_1463302 [Mycena metata]KAJ7763792.1 hypothetical protein B0H16DRAFT_1455047 [Mycena metata]